MKIQIKETRAKVIQCDVSSGPVPAIHDIHNSTTTEADFIAALKELAVLEPTFDFETAFTQCTKSHKLEYIVKCVNNNRFSVLDYIFDNTAVTPDLITHNGSPLILFAIQQSWEAFTYLRSRGAKLFRGDSELVRNTGRHPHVNVLFCANGNENILNVIFNVLHEKAACTKLDSETLMQGLSIGVSLGKSISQLRTFMRHTEIQCGDKLREPDGESPRGKLMALVAEKCTYWGQFKDVTGLDTTDIRWAMNVSLSCDRPGVYDALCLAFPKNRIE